MGQLHIWWKSNCAHKGGKVELYFVKSDIDIVMLAWYASHIGVKTIRVRDMDIIFLKLVVNLKLWIA